MSVKHVQLEGVSLAVKSNTSIQGMVCMIDGNLLQTTQRSFDLKGCLTVKSMVNTKRREGDLETVKIFSMTLFISVYKLYANNLEKECC